MYVLNFTLAIDKEGGLTWSWESPGIGGQSREELVDWLLDDHQELFTCKRDAVPLGAF